jgi:hypothetical protein
LRSDAIHAGPLAFTAAVLAAVSVALCCGCGGRAKADPVNPEQARQTLRTVLEGWKSGEPFDQWTNRSPKIVVQDLDWQSGTKLAGYEVLGPGKALDANLYCDVRLKVVGPRREIVQKTATYVVGTDPVLTVFRDVMQPAAAATANSRPKTLAR